LRLPKLLALAVGAVLLAGGGSALAIGSSGARGAGTAARSAVGRAGISGVAPVVSSLRDSSAGRLSGASFYGTSLSGSAGATSSTSAPASGSRSTPLGLSLPAGGAPVSSGLDPAAPSAPAPPSRGPATQLPTPTAGSLPKVAAMSNDVSPDAVVMLSSSATPAEVSALSKLKGVSRIETVDTGTVALGGAPVVAFGVDPATFRDVTPAASASSDQLWQYLAAGSLVSSYDMANDRSLTLGSVQTITPAASSAYSAVKGWLGAFASIGLPGVDVLVSHQYAGQLGLTPTSGVVVAAPGLDGSTLQSELQAALPNGAVELLHPDQLPTDLPGNVVGLTSRQQIIAAALSRVGRPYVWGGAGPSQFDCSGLVQWSFRQAGILMPRVAAEQFLTGDHIPLADAQPGDLLFWTYDPSDPGYVDHVAIYLGNGMMVVAPHTGTNVQVAPVPTDEFAGAVEVVLAK
jgi:cell wall-associated NlpC family hydrolase